jgi:hypothetical protein
MAVSIRHHGTTLCNSFTSQRGLLINEPSQAGQCLHREARLLFHHHRSAKNRIKHPAWNHDPQIFIGFDHDRGIFRGPQPAKHLNLPSEKWMKSIGDRRRTKLVSSV